MTPNVAIWRNDRILGYLASKKRSNWDCSLWRGARQSSGMVSVRHSLVEWGKGRKGGLVCPMPPDETNCHNVELRGQHTHHAHVVTLPIMLVWFFTTNMVQQLAVVLQFYWITWTWRLWWCRIVSYVCTIYTTSNTTMLWAFGWYNAGSKRSHCSIAHPSNHT